jgi:hypothetical protein
MGLEEGLELESSEEDTSMLNRYISKTVLR